NSFWVDGYFEETNLAPIRVGDPAQIKLMGYSQVLRGHVDSIARGINVSNAQPNDRGVATVNPIFTRVRLAQRIPVRIHLDNVPPDVILSAGMTATVEIDTRRRFGTMLCSGDEAQYTVRAARKRTFCLMPGARSFGDGIADLTSRCRFHI